MEEKQITTEEYKAARKRIDSPEHQAKVRKAVEDKLNPETKFDFFMPIIEPSSNKMYVLIKWYEQEILGKIAYTIPTPESREEMDQIRGKLKHIACRACEHKGQFKPVTTKVELFQRDRILSQSIEKTVLVQKETDVTNMVMSCEGCLGLRLKQIATGYIKGRRFKQI